MTACCQISCAIPWLPCEQLPYPPEHPQISRMRQRDKSDLPLPVLSYKYFHLRYSFSISSFYSPKSTFLAAALPENSKNFSKNLLQEPSKSSISPSPRKKWPSTSSSPRSVHHPSSFIPLMYSYSSAILFTEYFFPLSSCFFSISPIFKPIRNWPIRSWFLPINLTSNALVHWDTQIPPIW